MAAELLYMVVSRRRAPWEDGKPAPVAYWDGAQFRVTLYAAHFPLLEAVRVALIESTEDVENGSTG